MTPTTFWTVFTILAGACGTGFLFLQRQINEQKEHNNYAKQLSQDFKHLTKTVDDIYGCLAGDLDNTGLVNRVKEDHRRLNTLEGRVDLCLHKKEDDAGKHDEKG